MPSRFWFEVRHEKLASLINRQVREGKPFQANRIKDAHNLEGLVGDDLRDVAPSLSRSAVYIELIEKVSEI